MPWETRTTMSQRRDFVHLADQPGANVRELCRRFSMHHRLKTARRIFILGVQHSRSPRKARGEREMSRDA